MGSLFFMKELINNFKAMIIAVLFTIFLMNFIFINAFIPTSSMEKTIMVGNRVFGARFLHNYARGDIVIFNDPDGSGNYLIKRVIGLPGDEITIQNGVVCVNGSVLPEAYLAEMMEEEVDFSISIPEKGYFMMGDNRNNSFDARYWENPIVFENDIIGKALITYWPIAEFKILN